MRRQRWKHGPLSGYDGPVFVKATLFTYRHLWHLPAVIKYGQRLRHAWPTTEGAIGLSLAGDLLRRTTYTVSVWRSEDDLLRWVRSPEHLFVMRTFRSRVLRSRAIGWTVDRFDLEDSWTRALKSLSE